MVASFFLSLNVENQNQLHKFYCISYNFTDSLSVMMCILQIIIWTNCFSCVSMLQIPYKYFVYICIINLFFCMHIKSRLIKCCCLKVSTNMIISWWDIMDKKFRQMNNLVSTDSLVHYAENGGNIRKQYLIFTWTSQIRRLIMRKLLYNWNHKGSNKKQLHFFITQYVLEANI